MESFVVLLFLAVVAAGKNCDPPKQYQANYLSVGNNTKGVYIVKGKMIVDIVGKRIWETYNKVGTMNTGEILLLYKKDTMYIKTGGRCYKGNIPKNHKFTLEKLDLSKNAALLSSGHIADSGLKVDVYCAQVVKNGTETINTLTTVTADHCILVSSAYDANGEDSGQIKLFDVNLNIDQGKLVKPKHCQEIPPHVSDAMLK